MPSGEDTQVAWIAYLRSKPQVTSLLAGGANEIKELEWQGEVFSYPNIRVSVDYYPSVNGCGPDDFDLYIDVFSEEKSSKQAVHIAEVLQNLLHKKPFTQSGVKFPMVWVKKVDRPDRDIFAWRSTLHIKGLANDA